MFVHSGTLETTAATVVPLERAHVESRTDVRDAVVAVYTEHYRSLARLAYLLVGDEQSAEDLTHDAFTGLFEAWDRLHDPSRAVGYLRTSIVNLAHSSHRRTRTRRRNPHVALATVGDLAAPSAEDVAVGRSTRPAVVAALDELPERQRAAVVLRHWLRMTEGEIAQVLECSVGTVRTHIQRGHAALAHHLEALR